MPRRFAAAGTRVGRENGRGRWRVLVPAMVAVCLTVGVTRALQPHDASARPRVAPLGHAVARDQLGGELADAAIADGWAVLAVGHRIVGYDVGDPSAPRLEWRTAPFETPIALLSVSAGRAYAITGHGRRLHSVALAGADRGAVLGSLETPCAVGHMVAGEDHLYLTCGQHRATLVVVDVGAPAAMRVVASLYVSGGIPALGGDRLVLAAAHATVLDVGLPDQPRVVGTSDLELGFYDAHDAAMARSGSTDVLVVAQRGSLRTFALLPDGSLSSLGVAAMPEYGRLAVVGDHVLVVGDREALVHVYSLADPARPVPVATIDRSARPDGSTVIRTDPHNRIGVVTDGAGRATLLHVTEPAGAAFGQDLEVERTPVVFAVNGDLWLATDPDGLRVLDASDPSGLAEIGRLPLPGTSTSGALLETTAFLALGSHGLAVVDVSAPDRPRLVTTVPPVDAGIPTRLLALDGTRLAVADGRNHEVGPWQLRVLDVRDPPRPRQLGLLPLTDPPDRLWFEGDRLSVFTAKWPNSGPVLTNVDVSEPSRPRIVLRHPLAWPAADLVRDGETAYAAVQVDWPGSPGDWPRKGRIERLDVSDPTTVTLRAALDLDGTAGPLARDAGVLWAGLSNMGADGEPGIARLELAETGAPRLVEHLRLPDRPAALAVVDGFLLVNGEASGLLVLPPGAARPLFFPSALRASAGHDTLDPEAVRGARRAIDVR